MPKQHFCKKVNDTIICGEKNPENFDNGRYSICKSCKNKEVYMYQKLRKEKNKIETVTKIEEVVKDIDLKDVVLKIPLYNGETIMENFKSVIDSVDILRIKHNDNVNIMNLSLTIFQKNQNELREKYDILKIKYDELMKYCIDIDKNYKFLVDNKTGPFIFKN